MMLRLVYNRQSHRLDVYVDGQLVDTWHGVLEGQIFPLLPTIMKSAQGYSPIGLVLEQAVCNG